MTSIASNNQTSSILSGLDPSYQLPKATTKGSNELGQEQFLKLMIQQFKNQDPLKPQDPTQFLTQLAQVSSVAGISEMNQSMKTLADATYAAQALQASAVVGRDVLAPGSTAAWSAGHPVRGEVSLPVPTSSGVVRILDSTGGLVRQLPLGNRAAGSAAFTWDGLNSAGKTVAPGTYTMKASYDDGDKQVALDTYLNKRVASVSIGGDGKRTEINTDDGQTIGLADIRAIY